MNRFIISYYLPSIITLISFCNGQEGYRYFRPISEAFFSASDVQTRTNDDREKTFASPSRYSSAHGYEREISYRTRNSTISNRPNRQPEIVRFSRPAEIGTARNSTISNPSFQISAPFSTKAFLDSEMPKPNVVDFGAEAEKLTRRPKEPVEVESDDARVFPLELPASNHPSRSNIPTAKFSCASQKHGGYFADVETRCRLFHICANGLKYDYECPNGTVFDQRHFICDRPDRFDCGTAESLYDSKENLFDEDDAGRLIAHAAGATGARGPSAVYRPFPTIAAISAASLPHRSDSDPHSHTHLPIESMKPLVSSKPSAGTTVYSKRSDDLQAIDSSTDSTNSLSGFASYSASSQSIATAPQTVGPVPLFFPTFESTTESEMPANRGAVFSLHGQLIPYGAPFEPEKSSNVNYLPNKRPFGRQEFARS